MAISCEHNMKARKEGMCAPCAAKQPYTVYRMCGKLCTNCKVCGYFFGPGSPWDGKRMYNIELDEPDGGT